MREIFAGMPWWVKWVAVPVIALVVFGGLIASVVGFVIGLLFKVLVFVALVGGLIYVVRKFMSAPRHAATGEASGRGEAWCGEPAQGAAVTGIDGSLGRGKFPARPSASGDGRLKSGIRRGVDPRGRRTDPSRDIPARVAPSRFGSDPCAADALTPSSRLEVDLWPRLH